MAGVKYIGLHKYEGLDLILVPVEHAYIMAALRKYGFQR